MIEIRLCVDGETVVRLDTAALSALAYYGRKDRVCGADYWVDLLDDPDAPVMVRVRVIPGTAPIPGWPAPPPIPELPTP